MKLLSIVLGLLLLTGSLVAQRGEQGILAHKAASAGTWTLIQHVAVLGSSCFATATCTATVSSTGTGHLLVVLDAVYNTAGSVSGSTVTSGACSGSWQFPSGAVTFVGGTGSGTIGAYCLSSTSGVTSITITLSGSVGSGQQAMDVIEYAWSGSTISLDGTPGSANDAQSTDSLAGIALTISGAHDVIVQWGRFGAPGAATVSSISGSYSNPFDAPSGDGTGYAGWINTSSGSAPTWTLSTPEAAEVAAMAFSGS